MFFRKRDTSISWIIVFLGNPGVRYERTRHNIGFLTADVIEEKYGIRINRLKYNSLTTVGNIGNQKAFLMKPQTYMNLSGTPVKQAMRYYKVPIKNVIVVCDDVALPVAKLRVRRAGSAGGHNGLLDIIRKCGSEGFPRIKIGVGAPEHEDIEMADWVLSKFNSEEETQIKEAVGSAANALEMIITQGIEYAMAKYN